MAQATCEYHPDRPGVGVCMRCRVVICVDCCTRLDGINHCHACLKGLAVRPARPRRRGTMRGTLLIIALGWLALFGLMGLVQGKLAP